MTVESLIPCPHTITPGDGALTLTGAASLYADAGAAAVAQLVRDLLTPATELAFPVAASADEATIVLLLDPDLGLAHEGYRLRVSTERVTISAVDSQGLIWGVQTLRQLLPVDVFSPTPVAGVDWTMPAVAIEDAPRFAWRGTMLDVGRWFKPIEFLYKFVDLASMHKLNIVHLHLTDDQGWRVEIRKYPKLTDVGAWRAESPEGHYRDGRFDGTPHGGFYTQDQLRDLVAFAGTRGVTLVPEIDMPGHMQAAVASYPELGNNPDQKLDVATNWGIIKHVLNVEPATVRFMQDVLDEILDIFPSEYIHVGGDECPKVEWRASEAAQTRMTELGLADEDELQSWFIRQFDSYLEGKGRRMVGWDEILEGGLAPEATVMSWRGEEGGIAAARAAHDVVMAPNTYVYFDYYQSENKDDEPIALGGFIPLSMVYSYEPVPGDLMGDHAEHVLGPQCQLWCEYLPEPADVEYMAYPRTCALAEVAWGRTDDPYDAFLGRLRQHLGRLDLLAVDYRKLD